MSTLHWFGSWPRLVSIAVACLAAAACGDDGGGGGSGGATGGTGSTGGQTELLEHSVTLQGTVDSLKWDQVVAEDEQLGALSTQANADGYTELSSAGRVEHDGQGSVDWAVLAEPGADPAKERILLRMCLAGECTSASAQVSGGKAAFTNSAGQSVDAVFMANPGLVKDLPSQDHDSPTKLAAALTADEVPQVDLGKRRFILANAFGDVFGVTLSDLVGLANSSGAFTEVRDHPYVGAEVLVDAFQRSSPFDVVVWAGATVREKVGGAHKTIGMTVNRGIYGDATFKASTVKELLASSPFGGPGLVLLIGEETRGDGSSEEDKNLSLFKELSNAELGRVVVGFRGRAGLANVLEASRLFLTSFFGGATLAAALAEANTFLEGKGTEARMISSRESAADTITFVTDVAGIWEGGESPKEVRSNHYLNIANKCFTPSGEAYAEDEGHANFFVDVDFDGPFFSGSKVNADVGLDVHVEGILMGTEPGARIYVRFWGDLKLSVKDISVWGSGELVDEHNPDKPSRIFYKGQALATDYTNDKGDNCVLLAPSLTGSTSQPSWMDLP